MRGARSVGTRAGYLVLAALGLIAVLAPMIWGVEAETMSGEVRSGSTVEHWLGTDALGRDVLARSLVATRLTLVMAGAATVLAATLGIALGCVIAMTRGRVRGFGARLIDLLLAYPPIIVALVVAAVLGPGVRTSIIAIGLALMPSFARLTMTLAISVSAREFVPVTRGLGVSRLRLVLRHIVPNLAEPLLVLTSVALTTAIVGLSALSFLGIGVQSPSFDWGQMLNEGLRSLYTKPVVVLGPLIGILATGVAASLIGEGWASGADVRATRAPQPAADLEPVTSLADDLSPSDGYLRVRDLFVTPVGTAARPIVRGVTLSVRRGEILGVCGESGSGKTLMAQAIALTMPRSMAATAAELHLDGADLAGRTPAELAAGIGVVFQDPSAALNPAQRIGPQITEAYRFHAGAGRRAARLRAVQRLREVGVADAERVLRQYPHQLSGGLRQRVAIAMALMLDPGLLVADEPTTALDVTIQAGVLALLARLRRERGMTIVLISHDMGVVREICDRVAVMYAGRIVEQIQIDDLEQGRARHRYTRELINASPTSDLVFGRPGGVHA